MKKVIALGSIQNDSYRSNGAQRLHTKIIGALKEKKELPKKFSRWKNYFDIWHKYIKDIGSNCLQVNISHATSVNHFDGIIVGVDNFFQFQEIIHLQKEQQLSRVEMKVRTLIH